MSNNGAKWADGAKLIARVSVGDKKTIKVKEER